MDVGISINRKLYNIFIIIIICNYTKYNRTKQGETYFSVLLSQFLGWDMIVSKKIIMIIIVNIQHLHKYYRTYTSKMRTIIILFKYIPAICTKFW